MNKNHIIDGLTIIPNFINEFIEKKLLMKINKQKWNTELSRRTQHYGYKSRTIKKENYLEPLPRWCIRIINKMIHDHFIDDKNKICQVIINEYRSCLVYSLVYL
jgi:hypothetical protein